MKTILLQSVLDKIIIIDFDDSFTYNIAEVLYHAEKSYSVIHHAEFFSKAAASLNDVVENHAVILGPGPGHPRQYLKYGPQIEMLMNNPRIYLMGICLGHQLIGLLKGHDVREVREQLHGVNTEINFRNEKINVQWYNSLGVFSGKTESREIPILTWERGVSYQFHPESIGTSSPELFFRDLLVFISIHSQVR